MRNGLLAVVGLLALNTAASNTPRQERAQQLARPPRIPALRFRHLHQFRDRVDKQRRDPERHGGAWSPDRRCAACWRELSARLRFCGGAFKKNPWRSNDRPPGRAKPGESGGLRYGLANLVYRRGPLSRAGPEPECRNGGRTQPIVHWLALASACRCLASSSFSSSAVILRCASSFDVASSRRKRAMLLLRTNSSNVIAIGSFRLSAAVDACRDARDRPIALGMNRARSTTEASCANHRCSARRNGQ